MTSAFAEISGVVSQRNPDGRTQPVGEAVVTLSSGTDSTPSSAPRNRPPRSGAYQVGGSFPAPTRCPPAAVARRRPVVIVTVVAGESRQFNPVLIPPASITGKVTDQAGGRWPDWRWCCSRRLRHTRRSRPSRPPPTRSAATTFAEVDAPQAYVVEVRSRNRGRARFGDAGAQREPGGGAGHHPSVRPRQSGQAPVASHSHGSDDPVIQSTPPSTPVRSAQRGRSDGAGGPAPSSATPAPARPVG